MAYHHGNLRQALIEAAVEMVSQEGPDAVSVRKVARHAGVSSGAPFRHFKDKTELMTAVAEEGVHKLEARIVSSSMEAADEPSAQFRAVGIAYVLFAVEHPAHFRVMHRPEYSGEAVRASWNEGRERMRSLILAGQQLGSVGEGDPDTMILTAQALVYGVARMFVDGLFELEGVGDERAAEIAAVVTAQLGVGLGGHVVFE